jgi:antitoxin component YwqK of YwqJK toxin-antitoxin module
MKDQARIHQFFPVSLICLICLIGVSLTAQSQYYYKDITLTAQTNETFRIYLLNKVKAVKVLPSGGPAASDEGFSVEQKVSYRPNRVITHTKASGFGESYLIASYDKDGLLIRSTDSSGSSVSSSYYQYDAGHRLIQLTNRTVAADKSSAAEEIHTWNYSTDGRPVQMIRVKNGTDTTVVKITLDEKGNVEQEEVFRNNISLGRVYYYYDTKNRLTDVVRFNERAQQLMPDYVLEYEVLRNGITSMMKTD